MRADPLLILAPELGRVGGVQVFSRFVVRAAVDFVGHENVVVFGRNDTAEAIRLSSVNVAYVTGLGKIPAKLRAVATGPVVRRLVRRFRPSAVLCTHPHLAPAAVATSNRVIAICHGIDVWSKIRRDRRIALERCDRVLAVSRYTRMRLLEQIPGLADRTYVFPPTFDHERFKPGSHSADFRRELGIPDEAKILLTVARLEPTEIAKGYDDVVRAMPSILSASPKARYVLAGSGSDRARIASLAAELGVSDRVHLPGAIAPDRLGELYRSADVFVMPSRKEGFGIVFLESLASGTPVIAGDADGSSDALKDGAFGQLVPPGNLAAIATAVSLVLNRDRHELGFDAERIRRDVVDTFGYVSFRERLRAHLTELAAWGPAGATV